MLNALEIGTGPERPLVIAHGLFGSARNWGVVAKRLSKTRRVLSVDMRNHGDSPWFDRHWYLDLASDLAEIISALPQRGSDANADLLGHSMGGKAAMALALARPDKVARLIVADIAPVAYDHTQMPFLLAMKEMDLEGLSSRAAANARLSERVDDPAIRAFLLQSLDLRSDPPRWRLNLDVLEADMDEILGWPEIAGTFDGPTLFLSGGASDYVRPAHRETIRSLFPAARFARIPGAGHWLHAEKPREFVAAVDAFLKA